MTQNLLDEALVDQVYAALKRYTYSFTSEDGLQGLLAWALRKNGIEALREVRLSEESRIDILAGTVGIEVKVDGSTTDAIRQLHRYAQFEQIQSLVLVTRKSKHMSVPREISGKPVRVLLVGSAFV